MGVTLTKIVEKMELRNLTPDVDMTQREVKIPDINRPALQLAGFFDHFDCERIQLIGYVEYTYLQTLEYEHKMKIYDTLLEYGIPCFIFCRNLQPDPEFLEKAVKNNIPVFITDKQTSSFSAELIRWMKVELAPCISIHGVLVDCYGVGVLIMGDSGIGKSEAALELIKRGHRLVTDDVKTLFGVQSVRETQNIDLVITLEDWNKDREYDRLGLTEEYTEFLGNKVVCHSIPIRPGRNVAIIVESAAVNHRQKQMGYNAAQELYRRVQENLKKNM